MKKMNDMSKLPALAAQRIRANGETRLCNLRKQAAIRVLATTAHLWKVYKSGSKGCQCACGLVDKEGVK
jgi:hypothetical protein